MCASFQSRPVLYDIAGSGSASFADGKGTSAHFNSPWDVALDIDGNVIVADSGNHRIRKVATDGTVTTLAGSGSAGFVDGKGAAAHFNYPRAVALDDQGNVIVADRSNHRIRKVAADGTVTTLAGSGNGSFADGKGFSSHFNCPEAVALDGQGNLIVADSNNHRIRKVTPDGTVTTLAGSGGAGFADGKGAAALFNYPSGTALDGRGNVIVADRNNHRIRKVAADGTVTTVAGSGSAGNADGKGTSAHFNSPYSVALDDQGNIIVADHTNKQIRKIAMDGTVTTLIYSRIGACGGLACDGDGYIFVAVIGAHLIQKMIDGGFAPPPAKPARSDQLAHRRDLAGMLEDTQFADVGFKVNGETIHAHKAVLAARSSYFQTMFSGEWKEAHGQVEIQDTTPAAFRALLKYLYTDDLAFDHELIINVMRKAQEYELKGVYDHCVSYTKHNIGVNDAVLWLIQADQHCLAELRARALDFIKHNFKRIRAEAVQSLGLLKDYPDLMLQVMTEIEV